MFTVNVYCHKDPTDTPNEIPYEYNRVYIWKYVTTVQDIYENKWQAANWCVDGTHALTYKLYYLCSKTDTTPPCGASCKAEIKNKPALIRQCDSKWNPRDSELYYDDTYFSICHKGCALASLNMLMKSSGCNQVDFLETNACLSCFNYGGVLQWSNMLSKFCANIKYFDSDKDSYDFPNKEFRPVEQVIKEVNFSEDIRNGYKYVLHVKGSNKRCSHFVFLTGVSDDCKSLKVLDPASKGTSETSADKICGIRKFK